MLVDSRPQPGGDVAQANVRRFAKPWQRDLATLSGIHKAGEGDELLLRELLQADGSTTFSGDDGAQTHRDLISAAQLIEAVSALTDDAVVSGGSPTVSEPSNMPLTTEMSRWVTANPSCVCIVSIW